MMHYSMNTNESVVPLRKEIEHIKAYLELQKQRFEHQFEIIYDIDEKTPKPFLYLKDDPSTAC